MSRQLVYNIIRTMPDRELVAYIATATKTLLAKLREVVFGDCQCDWTILPCQEHESDCDCVVSRDRIMPCPHWLFHEKTTHVFSETVQTALIRALEPPTWNPSRSYADPPAPEFISDEILILHPRAKVGVMEARLARGQGLRSKLDFLKRQAFPWIDKTDELKAKLVRKVSRIGNGSDAVGELVTVQPEDEENDIELELKFRRETLLRQRQGATA